MIRFPHFAQPGIYHLPHHQGKSSSKNGLRHTDGESSFHFGLFVADQGSTDREG